MRRFALSAAVFVLAGALVATVSAGTARVIVGTAKNDVLRGTAKADTLDGRAGNDTLSGLAGNDVLSGGKGNDKLVGGPGRDKLRCGVGADTAVADAADSVGSDCEVVKGRPVAPTPPPTEPTPPPAAPAERALPGRYCGFTNQGKSICIDVTPDSLAVTQFETTSDVDCETATATFGLSFGNQVMIQPDLSFTFHYQGPIDSSDAELTNIVADYTVSGKFDTAGNASGTLFLGKFSFDYQATHYNCGAAPYAWQARRGA
jgi:Ca2+-binding RTX toxin-like protein